MSHRQDDAHDEHVRREVPDNFLEPPAIARKASDEIVAKLEFDEKFAPVPQPVEVMRVAVVSTRHLSQGEADEACGDWPTEVYESELGFVVWVGEVFYEQFKSLPEEERERWPGLFVAATWARALGLDWVRFDRDGDEQPGLSMFDW